MDATRRRGGQPPRHGPGLLRCGQPYDHVGPPGGGRGAARRRRRRLPGRGRAGKLRQPRGVHRPDAGCGAGVLGAWRGWGGSSWQLWHALQQRTSSATAAAAAPAAASFDVVAAASPCVPASLVWPHVSACTPCLTLCPPCPTSHPSCAAEPRRADGSGGKVRGGAGAPPQGGARGPPGPLQMPAAQQGALLCLLPCGGLVGLS